MPEPKVNRRIYKLEKKVCSLHRDYVHTLRRFEKCPETGVTPEKEDLLKKANKLWYAVGNAETSLFRLRSTSIPC